MGDTSSATYPSQVQDWRPGARLIVENWESARTRSGDIVASGKKAQGPRRAGHCPNTSVTDMLSGRDAFEAQRERSRRRSPRRGRRASRVIG